jgi:beta-lactamase regulating signal transducer with metallopeptidase domain
MIEHNVFEYLVNSLWQLPFLLLAAWLVIRIARPSLAVQHTLWFVALTLGILLPLRGIEWNRAADPMPSVSVDYPFAADPLPSQLPPPSPPFAPSHKFFAPQLRDLATLRIRPIHLASRTIEWLIGLYAVSAALSLARLVHGWIAARRLVESAEEHPLTTLEAALLRTCAERLHLSAKRIPHVRFLSKPEASPMVVGVRCPVLLLPESMRHTSETAFDDARLAAVLLHELAHVRRRDYLANLIARVVSLPIAYHPATHSLQRRIRQTREMICDFHAAGAFPSNCSYARSLLALAEGLVSPQLHVEAVGLFDHTRHSLEERIMKLTEPKLPVSLKLRTARVMAGTLVLVAGTGAAATLHVKAATPLVYAMQTPQAAPAPAADQTQQPQVPAPAPQPDPKPQPAPTVIVNGHQVRKLTPEERADMKRQLDAAQEQMRAATQQLKNLPALNMPNMDLNLQLPELKQQLGNLKIQMDSPEFRQSMEQLKQAMNSAEFKQKMAEAANGADIEVLNNPAFKQQMDALTQQFNSSEFKQKMDEYSRQFNSPEFKQQMDQFNRPEFKQQMEEARRMALQAQADSGRPSAETRKQLADVRAAIAEAQRQVNNEAVQQQLSEALRRLQEIEKTLP